MSWRILKLNDVTVIPDVSTCCITITHSFRCHVEKSVVTWRDVSWLADKRSWKWLTETTWKRQEMRPILIAKRKLAWWRSFFSVSTSFEPRLVFTSCKHNGGIGANESERRNCRSMQLQEAHSRLVVSSSISVPFHPRRKSYWTPA